MKNKIAYILVFILFLSTLQGLITSAKKLNEEIPSRDFTHTVFIEIGTSQNCKPCHYWNQIIHEIYTSDEYDFQYVEMIVFDYNGELLNDEAKDWYSYYDVGSVPKNIMDGDYRRISNNSETFIEYLNECGNRAVADISTSMTVQWLGNATIKVNIYIRNKEGIQYNGHIRASITEIVSRYNTIYDEPYHFGFLDFAFDKDISITAGGTYTDSITWDGNEHQDNQGNDFGDIDPENIQVTMGVLNNDDGYVDETVKAFVSDNNPPSIPVITGPESGYTDTSYSYEFNSTDPEGDNIFYFIKWGDGTDTGWLGPYQSNESITKSHSWSEPGNYTIQAKARDTTQQESDWGNFTVSISSKPYEPKLKIRLKMISMGKVRATIQNKGSEGLSDIKYNITVKGGILRLIKRIDIKANGTIENLAEGEKKLVSTPDKLIKLRLCVAKVTVTATVDGKTFEHNQFVVVMGRFVFARPILLLRP